jgi:hypothetical protein
MKIGYLIFAVCSLLAQQSTVPGVADPKITQDNINKTICVSGYTKKIRNVPTSEKKQVYLRDKLKPKKPICCEVDHLISLELGGTNDLNNLWAQRYEPFPGARDKDKVENALHKDICSGAISLKRAQEIISKD